MPELWRDYPYLFSHFFGIIIYATLWALFHKQRKLMLLSSILALPQALIAFIVVPVYWKPRLIVDLVPGIEDYIFTFTNGGIAWMAAANLTAGKTRSLRPGAFSLSRLLFSIFFGVAIISLLHFSGLRGMKIPLILIAAWGILMIILRKNLVFLGARGAVFYSLYYFLIFIAAMIIWPDYYTAWRWEELWGLTVWKMPLEEIVWAALFGAVWPMTVAYIFDVRIEPRATS